MSLKVYFLYLLFIMTEAISSGTSGIKRKLTSNINFSESKVVKGSSKKSRSKTHFRQDDSDLEIIANFDTELYPLEHYIQDPAEMIEQVFCSIEEQYLQKMLPPLLTNMSVGELKSYCLSELKKMNKDEIKNVLTERYADCVSSDEENSAKNKKSRQSVKNVSNSPNLNPAKLEKTTCENEDLASDLLLDVKQSDLDERSLLELQMRARAIQSALRQCRENSYSSFESQDDTNDCHAEKIVDPSRVLSDAVSNIEVSSSEAVESKPLDFLCTSVINETKVKAQETNIFLLKKHKKKKKTSK